MPVELFFKLYMEDGHVNNVPYIDFGPVLEGVTHEAQMYEPWVCEPAFTRNRDTKDTYTRLGEMYYSGWSS